MQNYNRLPKITKGLDDMLDVRFYFRVPSKLYGRIIEELNILEKMPPIGEGYSRRELHVHSGQPRYLIVDKIDDRIMGTSETGDMRLSSVRVRKLKKIS